MQHGRTGRLSQQLGLAGSLHRDEPPHRLVDRGLPDGQQAVVREDQRLVPTERVGDPLALFQVEHDARVVVEDRVVAVERAGVLGQRIERPAQRRPRLTVHGMRMGGRDDVRTSRVDLRVDREGRRVDRPIALDDLTAVVDQDEVPDPDELEVHAERVDPEVVEQLRVPCRDVAGDPFVESELSEQPERGGEPLLAVPALVLDVVECRESGGRRSAGMTAPGRCRAAAGRATGSLSSAARVPAGVNSRCSRVRPRRM